MRPPPAVEIHRPSLHSMLLIGTPLQQPEQWNEACLDRQW
jgi:hypothetical protein